MTNTPSSLFEALQQQFGARIQSTSVGRGAEVYFLLSGPDARPITEYLRSTFGARLVTVFAEDRRASERVFYNYYVFEQKGSAQYLVGKAPVRADQPEFPSLSAELPSVNWQEREIQDWFGLRAVGHPNPRRVAFTTIGPMSIPCEKTLASTRCCHPSQGNAISTGPPWGKAFSRFPLDPSTPESSNLATSTLRWRANPFSICSCACSIPTRVRKSSSKTCRYRRLSFWQRASRGIRVFHMAQLSVRPSNERLAWKFRRALSSCARSCWSSNGSRIMLPTSEPSPPMLDSSSRIPMPAA